MKSNKSKKCFCEIVFLAVLNFFPVQKLISGHFWNCKKKGIWSKEFFVKLIYLSSRVFLAWTSRVYILELFLLQEADDSEDFDFIDLEDVVGTRQRCPSSTDAPSPLASQIVNLDLKEQPPRPPEKDYTQDCDTKIVVIPSSVESDYPELSSDFALKSSNSSTTR